MQHINLIRWLKDVVEGLGGTTPGATRAYSGTRFQKGTYFRSGICSAYRFCLDGTKRGTNLLEDTDGFNCTIAGVAQIWTTYESLEVEACLRQLKDRRYFIPDFSYFRVKQLQAREYNVILTTERLCRLNRQDGV